MQELSPTPLTREVCAPHTHTHTGPTGSSTTHASHGSTYPASLQPRQADVGNMTLLPESRESHIPGSSRSGTSPFGPMAHVSVTDKHHSPFSTSGPPGGAQGLLTRNGHIPPRDIVAHLTAGLGGGCREGKEVAPFWNSVLFPSQRRSLSLPAWTSASSSVTLCDTEGQCGVYHSTGWPPDASLQARPSSLGLQGTFPTQQPSTEPPGAPPAFQDRPRIQKKVLLLEQENPGPVLLSSRKPQSMIPA